MRQVILFLRATCLFIRIPVICTPHFAVYFAEVFFTHSGISKHFQKALVKIYEIAVKKMRKKCK